MGDHPTDVRTACLESPRIDTHAHLFEGYPSLDDPVAHFETTQHLIDSRVAAEGCRVLYGRDIGSFLRPDSDPEVFAKAAALRAKGKWAAVEHALDTARIEKQIAFTGFHPAQGRPFADEAPPGKLSYLAYVDSVINGSGTYPCPDTPTLEGSYYDHLCAQLGPLEDLEAYLGALDAAIDGWRSHGVAGMKTAVAYTSGLAFSDPAPKAAQASFARKDGMTDDDVRVVRDTAMRHVLTACLRNGLPAVFHTGFQIWGHSRLDISNPMLLHNVIADRRYRDLTFVLLHGGNPYVGGTTYLAGMFPNVVIDFTWIGWMTPPRFRMALAEWLACVPHDRMCWGSDSCTPESICGIDSIVRRLIADVLEEALRERLVDERHALEFVENTYRSTPRRVFGL